MRVRTPKTAYMRPETNHHASESTGGRGQKKTDDGTKAALYGSDA